MSSKLPIILILVGILTVTTTGFLYFNGSRTEEVSAPPSASPTISAIPSASTQALVTASPPISASPVAAVKTPLPTRSVRPASSAGPSLSGYTLVQKNSPIKLNENVELTVLGAFVASALELKQAELGFGGQIVNPTNGALIVMYTLKNNSTVPQAIFHRVSNENIHPFMIFDSKSRIDIDNDIMSFTLLDLDNVTPKTNEHSAMLFEIPKKYTSVDGLNFVADFSTFVPAKGYTPLFQLTELLKKELGPPSMR